MLSQYNKIYVVCPAGHRTGGVELLHQLVWELNSLNKNAMIAYTNTKDDTAIELEYLKYVDEFIDFEYIEDYEESLIVISEHQIELMDRFRYAKVIIWWLSVDNYMKVYSPITAFKLIGIKGVLWYVKNCRWKYRVSRICAKLEYNLAQSYYAMEFLRKNKFKNIAYLSDYINTDFIKFNIGDMTRKNVVLYNPKKGIKFSKRLMKADKTIQWIPLINLSSQEVRELMLSSKVYVDFGNHPGKDRFPREAVSCGCCIITGKKGSAKFYNDVPIDNKYKFEDKRGNVKIIIERIHECLNDFNDSQKDFDEYRKIIASERQNFANDVQKIFGRNN